MSNDLSPKKHKFTKKKLFLILDVIFLLLIIIGIIIFFTFYVQDSPKTKPTISKKKEKEPIPEPEVIKKLTIFNEDSNQRPIAVMIDNNIGDGLHAGLQESYLNYEIIVEGGLTRIMALYKDKNVSLIGPVRSSRHYFLDYALESDAIYAHFGWSPYAQNDISALGVNNLNGLYDDAFWRDYNIAAPHNVFTSVEKIYSYAALKNYSQETTNWHLLNYSTDEINLNPQIENNTSNENQTTESNSTKKSTNKSSKTKETPEPTPSPTATPDPNLLIANNINFSYSNYEYRTYTYDANRKVYLRFRNNSPHLDKTTLQQLNYKNILIIRVNNKTLDREGRQDLDTVGTGEGYFITNGYALPITWTKSLRSAKTIYRYLDGKDVILNDGNTFINIIPLTRELTIT